MLKSLPKDHKFYRAIEHFISAKQAEKLATVLGNAADARSQYVLLLTAQTIADSQRGINHMVSLADTIISQQNHKIVQYGEKAYRLSEKQVDVIVRDVIG